MPVVTAPGVVAAPGRALGVALAVAALVVGTEYFFRHYVLFWLPVFGTLLVNDMLVLALAYALLVAGLGALLPVRWRDELAGIGATLLEGLRSWTFTSWVLALVLSVWALSALDRQLWGRLDLPMVASDRRSATLWLADLAPLLKVASLLLVNGLFVPITEEYLWRGVVQARLARVLAAPAAIGITALLFSLKHAIVDASLARLLTLLAFGAICGAVAHRHGWRQSAALHLVVNSLLTAVSLGLGRT